jgi:hypothetical protein
MEGEMTTPETNYFAEHLLMAGGRPVSVVNPHNKPIEELPVIYGYSDGIKSPTCYLGKLIAEDGTELGEHICSNEAWMLRDLGILEGEGEFRRKDFEAHYPDGYRMAFVSEKDVPTHEGLNAAFKLNPEMEARKQPQITQKTTWQQRKKWKAFLEAHEMDPDVGLQATECLALIADADALEDSHHQLRRSLGELLAQCDCQINWVQWPDGECKCLPCSVNRALDGDS